MERIDETPSRYLNRWLSDLIDIVNSSFTAVEGAVPGLTLSRTDPAPTEDMDVYYEKISSALAEIYDRLDKIESKLRG